MKGAHKSKATRRRRPTWPEPTLPIDGVVFAVDPGPVECGWCLLEVHPGAVPVVGEHGHDLVEDVLRKLRGLRKHLALVAVEAIVPHSLHGVPGASKATLATQLVIGRFAEAARGIPFVQLSRREVIHGLLGYFPTAGVRVSKRQMQDAVQEILALEEPIRPQHANDACCAGLAVTKKLEEALETSTEEDAA